MAPDVCMHVHHGLCMANFNCVTGKFYVLGFVFNIYKITKLSSVSGDAWPSFAILKEEWKFYGNPGTKDIRFYCRGHFLRSLFRPI